MLLPIKAIINPKPRKDGKNLIFFQYCYSSTNRVLLNTEIAVPKIHWNKKRQSISKSLPAEYGNAETLNSDLRRMLKTIETIVEHGIRNDVENLGNYVKGLFTPTFNADSLSEVPLNIIPVKRKVPKLFDQIDDYIKGKEKKVVSTAVLKQMKERLLAYQAFSGKEISFSSLDYNFYLGFVDFLTYDYQLRRKKTPEYGLKLSTIGTSIKHLRVFVNDRVRRKIIPAIDLKDFKILDEEADAVYLTNEEIGKIYYADLTEHPCLMEYRDLFVLGCLTGLRFSDYSTLDFKDFRKGMLYKKTQKTTDWVVIPLKNEAKEIFIRQLKSGTPKVSNPVFNRYIKQIANIAGITEEITFSYKKGNKDVIVTKPKYDWVTSHTCRRSFCTNEYLAGTDVNLIMRISGHKTYKDFFKYIRINQEEAAKKILEIWNSRGNMQAFTMPISKTA